MIQALSSADSGLFRGLHWRLKETAKYIQCACIRVLLAGFATPCDTRLSFLYESQVATSTSFIVPDVGTCVESKPTQFPDFYNSKNVIKLFT